MAENTNTTAAETTAEDTAANTTNDSANNTQDAATKAESGKTFTQEEVNKIVSDRVSETNKKWQEKMSESEKLSKMTADQKAEHERQKREKEFADREKSITVRELKMSAKEILVERALPLTLAEALDYSDADKCNASIDAIEKAFRASVDKAVSERIKSSAGSPKTGADVSATEQEAARKIMGLSIKK